MKVFSKAILSFLVGICWNGNCHCKPNEAKGQGIVFCGEKLFPALGRSMVLCNVTGYQYKFSAFLHCEKSLNLKKSMCLSSTLCKMEIILIFVNIRIRQNVYEVTSHYKHLINGAGLLFLGCLNFPNLNFFIMVIK